MLWLLLRAAASPLQSSRAAPPSMFQQPKGDGSNDVYSQLVDAGNDVYGFEPIELPELPSGERLVIAEQDAPLPRICDVDDDDDDEAIIRALQYYVDACEDDGTGQVCFAAEASRREAAVDAAVDEWAEFTAAQGDITPIHQAPFAFGESCSSAAEVKKNTCKEC